MRPAREVAIEQLGRSAGYVVCKCEDCVAKLTEDIHKLREEGARWMLENFDKWPDPADVRKVAP